MGATKKKKRYWIADQGRDLEGGWTLETESVIGTEEFWAEADRYVGCFIDKAITVDESSNWIDRDICFR